jgi:hypothetical protein
LANGQLRFRRFAPRNPRINEARLLAEPGFVRVSEAEIVRQMSTALNSAVLIEAAKATEIRRLVMIVMTVPCLKRPKACP